MKYTFEGAAAWRGIRWGVLPLAWLAFDMTSTSLGSPRLPMATKASPAGCFVSMSLIQFTCQRLIRANSDTGAINTHVLALSGPHQEIYRAFQQSFFQLLCEDSPSCGTVHSPSQFDLQMSYRARSSCALVAVMLVDPSPPVLISWRGRSWT